MPFWPVDDVRGGIALGEEKLSGVVLTGLRGDTFVWNIVKVK